MGSLFFLQLLDGVFTYQKNIKVNNWQSVIISIHTP